MKNSKEKISLPAKNYAFALADVADKNNIPYEQFSKELDAVKEILHSVPDLRNILNNPTIPYEIKREIAQDVFRKDVSGIMLNFLRILLEKKRFIELPQIHRAFIDKMNYVHKIQPVTIVSAVELSAQKKSEVIQKLESKLNKTVQPDWTLDEELIAGLVIKINDDVIDMSVRNRLAKLKKDLMIR